MDLMQTIMSLLSGDVLNKLSAMIGKDPDTTRKAVATAAPALLAGMSHVASTPEGAKKMVAAMGQPSPPGDNLGSMMTGQPDAATAQGGSMLNSLFGNNASGLAGAVSKLTGLDSAATTKMLSFLTPLVMGSISKQFSGGSLNPASLMSMFSSQKSNIAGALPAGFSLAGIPGLSGAANAMRDTASAATGAVADAGHAAYRGTERAAETVSSEAAKAASSATRWAVPALIGVCILAAVIYIVRSRSEAPAPPPTAGISLPDATKVTASLTGTFNALTDSISGIKDVASAESAIPRLQELERKLDLAKGWAEKLPKAARPPVATLAGTNLIALVNSMNNALKIPGVPEKLRPVLASIAGKVGTIAGVPSSQYTLSETPATPTAQD